MLTDVNTYDAKILIVDDEPDIVKLLQLMLVEAGYKRIRSTTDSRDVASIYQEFRPDLVLLDIRMPFLSGFQVMEELNEIERGGYVPVLVMTAQGDRENRLRAYNLGARDFLTKPFDFSEVLARIRNLIEVRMLYNRLGLNMRRLQAVLDATGDAIVMFDAEERLAFANRQFQEWFELDPEKIVGQTADELRERIKSRFQEPAQFVASDREFFADPERVAEGIVEVREPTPRLFYRFTSPVRDTSEEIVGRIVVYRDASKDAQIEEMKSEVLRLRAELGTEYRFDQLIGDSPKMRELFALMERTLDSDISVLIEGESGTGKELVARAIHFNSHRKNGPFIAVNCAAIPETLIESELFGHERGAFTGASSRRVGRFEQANGGTIFLDEIGEMDLSMQVRLLRVLQEREIQRVGGTATIPVDVRILAATNQDLREAVQAGRFREDLYYRIAAFPIRVPPLRERLEDIPLLVEHFLKKYSERMGRAVMGVSHEALRYLMQYDWPGNVRELENVVQRAILLETTDTLQVASLAFHEGSISLDDVRPSPPEILPGDDEILPLDEIERRAIIDALRKTENNISRAAQALGINRATLYRKIERYGLAANE